MARKRKEYNSVETVVGVCSFCGFRKTLRTIEFNSYDAPHNYETSDVMGMEECDDCRSMMPNQLQREWIKKVFDRVEDRIGRLEDRLRRLSDI